MVMLTTLTSLSILVFSSFDYNLLFAISIYLFQLFLRRYHYCIRASNPSSQLSQTKTWRWDLSMQYTVNIVVCIVSARFLLLHHCQDFVKALTNRNQTSRQKRDDKQKIARFWLTYFNGLYALLVPAPTS